MIKIIRNWDNNGIPEGEESVFDVEVEGFENEGEGGDHREKEKEGPKRKPSSPAVKKKAPRKGKWVVVGDALNRAPDCCSQRYRDTLSKKPYVP